jgi:hypothetical protein
MVKEGKASSDEIMKKIDDEVCKETFELNQQLESNVK